MLSAKLLQSSQKYSLPVDVAAFTKFLLKFCFKRSGIEKCLAPPVTEIMRGGASMYQHVCINSHTAYRFVSLALLSTRTY